MRGIRSLTLFIGFILLISGGTPGLAPAEAGRPGGSLTVIHPDVKPGTACPLEHTSVKVEVSGFISRVQVTQTFKNPLDKKIEAVYTFPLSADGAVDEMLMRVGDREIKGVIKKREEARRIYDEARQSGKTASLLDQERPNIFTQSVANISPGAKVEVTIKYVETLPFDDGAFTFSFPMVVGPRFIPGTPAETSAGTGWAKDTAAVPDASRITPPVTPSGTRAGHDVDLTVAVDAGVPISDIESKLHEVTIERPSPSRATISLKNNNEIPNRDFVLKYTASGDHIRSGVLTHRTGAHGYATVVIIPPKRVKPEEVAPKEMIFVIDCSGSQSGWPLEKAKEAMKYFIDHMNPDDTFNIIDFNVGARQLFSEPKRNSPETRKLAQEYMQSLHARGGTWMADAVAAVCKNTPPENRLRIVTFMTDGYVGNDFEIIGLVRKLRGNSRWFPFGTGNSVNRFLLDNMARVGGGEVEYLLLNTPGSEAAKRFYERISAPVLTDAKLNAQGVTIEDMYPAQPSDLWARKPLIFKARYTSAGKGALTIKGFAAGKPYEEKLPVTFPENEEANAALASLWARAKVDALMDEDLFAAQQGNVKDHIKEEIIKTALEHKIMTQFTSFVAVEETLVHVGGEPLKIVVPVEMPDGVSREGVFGEPNEAVKSAEAVSSGVGGGLERTMGVAAPRKISPSVGQAPASPPRAAPHSRMSGYKDINGADARFMMRAPMEHREAKANSDEKRKGEADDKFAKLAPELRSLLELIKKGKDIRKAAKEAKVTLDDGQILVQVSFAGDPETVVKEMEKEGLTVIFRGAAGKTLLGKIAPKNIEKLAALEKIIYIKPAAPEK